ncbi:flippase-like domain-containing protein [candidate division KSB1 bacterium]|nr:flippase-like domain-containing protein [candidate division KSB1 bacterium]
MRRHRQFIANIGKILFSIILIGWLLQRIGVENIIFQLTSANWFWVFVALLTFAVSNLLGAFQWFLLLRSQDVHCSFMHALSYYHVGLFFNNFLIGYIGGDAFRIYDIARHVGDATVAVSSVMFDRFVGFFTMTTIAMGVSVVGARQLASPTTLYFIGIILVVWLMTLFLLFNENAGRAFGRLFKPILPNIINEKINDVYMATNRIRHHRLILVQLVGISVVVQTLRIVTHYYAALSVGVSANVLYFFIFIPIVALFASLPISFGGIGVREQSGVALFSTIGLAASKVVTFEFLAYIIGIAATIPGGVIFALRREERKMAENIQHAPLQNGGSSNE